MGGWIVAFYAIALVIASAVTLAGVRAGKAVPAAFRALFESIDADRTFVGLPAIVRVMRTRPWAGVIVAFAAAPSIAAIVIAIAGAPVDLLRSLRPWNDTAAVDGLVVYTVIAVGFGAVCAWYLRITRAMVTAGSIATPPLLRNRTSLDIGTRLGVGALVDEGGALEELGWRAALLPLVLIDLERAPATLVVGAMWWFWHMPREVPGWRRLPSHRRWARDQAVFALLCLALSVLCTEAVLRTGGSVWPAVLIHGGSNVWSKSLGAGPNTRWSIDVRTVIIVVLAVAVAATWMV
jgi:membrane protease YdiL (CAAX protease family)